MPVTYRPPQGRHSRGCDDLVFTLNDLTIADLAARGLPVRYRAHYTHALLSGTEVVDLSDDPAALIANARELGRACAACATCGGVVGPGTVALLPCAGEWQIVYHLACTDPPGDGGSEPPVQPESYDPMAAFIAGALAAAPAAAAGQPQGLEAVAAGLDAAGQAATAAPAAPAAATQARGAVEVRAISPAPKPRGSGRGRTGTSKGGYDR